MFYFLVSGYIPGTDIQLTFDVILLFAVSFGIVFFLFLAMRSFMHKIEALGLQEGDPIEEIAL